MKKVLNYILLTAVLGTFLPYSALAQTTDVGVSITGSVSIDVVTTISANITLDLTTGETTPTYMEIQNNSSVPVNAKITNISTTSEGAPSTFVGQHDKDWLSLSKTDTNTYVNFNILGEGQNVIDMPKDILPNTEVDLGTLSSYDQIGVDSIAEVYLGYAGEDVKYYEINANFGKNWDEGDKNFTYQIETVYSQAEEYVDPTLSYTYPDILNSSSDGYDKIYNIKVIDLTNDLSAYENLEGFNQTIIDANYPRYYYVVEINFREHFDLNYSNIKIAMEENYNSYRQNTLKLIDNGRLLFLVKASNIDNEFVTLNIALEDNNDNWYGNGHEFTYTEIVKIMHN